MHPAGKAQPGKEKTQKIVTNIFKMKHFTAGTHIKDMINDTNQPGNSGTFLYLRSLIIKPIEY
jgi:hypothetical protein